MLDAQPDEWLTDDGVTTDVTARSQYSAWFRQESARLARLSRQPLSVVARDLSVPPSTLRRWVHEQEAAHPTVQVSADDVPALAPARAAERTHAAEPVQAREPMQHGYLARERSALSTSPNSTEPAVGDDSSAPLAPDDLWALTQRVGLLARCLIIATAWALSLLLSTVLQTGPLVRDVALTVHVISLVVAFGAVLVIDWHGLLWLAGRRSFHESLRLAAATAPLIWLGVTGLLCSGALLGPDLSNPLTVTKLVLVLGAALNGAVVSVTRQVLAAAPYGVSILTLPRHLRRRMMTSTVISQSCWWGAIAIGFISTANRR